MTTCCRFCHCEKPVSSRRCWAAATGGQRTQASLPARGSSVPPLPDTTPRSRTTVFSRRTAPGTEKGRGLPPDTNCHPRSPGADAQMRALRESRHFFAGNVGMSHRRCPAGTLYKSPALPQADKPPFRNARRVLRPAGPHFPASGHAGHGPARTSPRPYPAGARSCGPATRPRRGLHCHPDRAWP